MNPAVESQRTSLASSKDDNCVLIKPVSEVSCL